MNIDGLDSEYGLAKVGHDSARYIALLQQYFDSNVNLVQKVREAMRLEINDEASRLVLDLRASSELVGAHVIGGKAEALIVALTQGSISIIEHQVDGLETELRHLLEDIRWYL